MAFSSVTARGSNVSNANGTTLAVSPSANLTVGKIVFACCTSDNESTTDGATTMHSVGDSVGGNTWTKIFEATETDGAANDGSTTSLWWTKVKTQIGTGASITLTLGSSRSDKIISIFEVTVGANKTLQSSFSGFTGFTPSASGTSLSHTLSSLTSREYLLVGLFGAEGEDTAKTPDADYTELFDLVSTTAGAADANVQQHVQTRIATLTGDTVTSSDVTFTSGIQSLTACYEVDDLVGSVAPPAGNITLAALAPTVEGVASADETAFQADAFEVVAYQIYVSGAVTSPAANVTLAALAPAVVGNQSGAVTVPAANVTFAAVAPTVAGAQSASVSPPAFDITFLALAPAVSGAMSGSVAPPASDIALAALAPTVDGNDSAPGGVNPPSADIAFAALAPTVAGVAVGSVAAPAADIALAALAPVVAGAMSGAATVPAADIALAALAPTVAGAQTGSVTAPAADIALAALAPTATGNQSGTVTPPAADIVFAAVAPLVSGAMSASVTPPAIDIALAALAPSVIGGGDASVSPQAANIVMQALAPTVSGQYGRPLLDEGYYYFANSVDLGEVFTSRVTASVQAQGAILNYDFFAAADFFAPADFFGFDSTGWAVVLEQRVSNDAEADTGAEWSDWQEFQASDYTARSFQWRLFLGSSEEGVTPLVTAVRVTIDMPDRVIAGNDLAVPEEGLRIDFDPPYRALKGIGVAAQEMETGDYYRMTDKSEDGFTIRFYDDADAPVARSFDYVAVGYGRLLVIEEE
jgi:hypothetical protein